MSKYRIYFLTLLISPVATYFILLGIRITVNNFGLYSWKIGSIDAWIGYAGSIIGSLITILTVINALRIETNIRKADAARNAQPVLFIKPKFEQENYLFYTNDMSSTQRPIEIIFTISNLSDNVANNVRVGLVKIRESDIFPTDDIKKTESKFGQVASGDVKMSEILQKGDSIKLTIYYSPDLDHTSHDYVNLEIPVSFEDIQGIGYYYFNYIFNLYVGEVKNYDTDKITSQLSVMSNRMTITEKGFLLQRNGKKIMQPRPKEE